MSNEQYTMLWILLVAVFLVIVGFIIYVVILIKKKRKAKWLAEASERQKILDQLNTIQEEEVVVEIKEEEKPPYGILFRKEETEKGEGYSIHRVEPNLKITNITVGTLVEYLKEIRDEISVSK